MPLPHKLSLEPVCRTVQDPESRESGTVKSCTVRYAVHTDHTLFRSSIMYFEFCSYRDTEHVCLLQFAEATLDGILWPTCGGTHPLLMSQSELDAMVLLSKQPVCLGSTIS